MQRFLPYNYDGSSCFMNSLLCALFFPNRLRIMDTYLLQGRRAESSETLKELCGVLRTVAKCIRGSLVCDVPTYTAVRPVLSYLLYNLSGVQFSHGQHDPVDLFEALLRVCNVGGVFVTRKTVETLYHSGQQSKVVTTDQMFCHSVLHSLNQGVKKFEALFPSIETLTPSEGTDLQRQRTILEFGGGPVLVLTRETGASSKSVEYGRYSAATKGYYLPMLNTVDRCVQWYELQAVLCWKGLSTGTAGHYVCFVYDDSRGEWYFYNDMNNVGTGFTALEVVPEGLETHSVYPPSYYGTMYIYSKVASPPSDVQ